MLIDTCDFYNAVGTYPIKPTLPAVGGNEGVFEVMQVGSKCNKLKQGDRVLPVTAGWGKCTAWWFVNNFFVVVCNSGNDSSQGHCLQLAMKLD